MSRVWNHISNLGVDENLPSYKQRGIILSNQISIIFIVAIVASFTYLATLNDINQIFNASFLFLSNILVLIFNRFGKINISRLVGSIFPSVVLYIPLFFGSKFDQISFIYFSYSIIAFSVIPVMVFDIKRERSKLSISLLFCFLSLVLYDSILFGTQDESVLYSYFLDNSFVIKSPTIELWMVIILSMLFLKNLNSRSEKKLNDAYKKLKTKNEEILLRLEEIAVANEEFKQQQEQIVDQRDFIEKKNGELKEYQNKLLDYLFKLSESKDQLAKKEAENKSLLKALRNNFIMAEFDLDGNVSWVAPKTIAYLGVSEEDMIGTNSLSFIKYIDEKNNVKESFMDLWRKILNGQSVSSDLELELFGKSIHISITYAPIMDAKGKPSRVLAIAEDITDVTMQKIEIAEMNKVLLNQQKEIKDQNEILHQQKEEISAMNETLEDRVKERTTILEQKNKQLAEYAFINAHLLRAPVSSILGLISLLEYEKLSKNEQEIYRYLKKSINHLDRIVFKINRAIQQNKEIDREFLRE